MGDGPSELNLDEDEIGFYRCGCGKRRLGIKKHDTDEIRSAAEFGIPFHDRLLFWFVGIIWLLVGDPCRTFKENLMELVGRD